MDHVFCPEENAFSDVRGLKGPFTCLNSARFGIPAGLPAARAHAPGRHTAVEPTSIVKRDSCGKALDIACLLT